jgi:CelD/BcsL family acetyltransferase involved in cellulose biosynthesis
MTDYSSLLPARDAAQDERQSTSPGMSIASVEVHRDYSAVAAAWAELEAIAPISAYQTQAFTISWLETIGAARGIEPLFILGRDRHERAAALICLGIERFGPFRIASFLGGKESNFNLGLFRPNVAVTAADLRFLFKSAAKAVGRAKPDLFLLKNQPFEWEGSTNPLALLPHQQSPSFAYATQLGENGEKFLATKLSKDTRKKLRKKEARLAELGPVSLTANDTPAAARAIVDAFLAEKIARCEARSIETDFGDPAMRAFLEKLSASEDGSPPWLAFHALKVGERIVATYAGAAYRGRFSCLLNSFDNNPEISKSSPGDLLLMRLIASQCDRGLASFDLGIGEARYKGSYCDLTVPLFDMILPVGVRGRFCAIYAKARLKMKRRIKQDPKMFGRIMRLRRVWPGLAVF